MSGWRYAVHLYPCGLESKLSLRAARVAASRPCVRGFFDILAVPALTRRENPRMEIQSPLLVTTNGRLASFAIFYSATVAVSRHQRRAIGSVLNLHDFPHVDLAAFALAPESVSR